MSLGALPAWADLPSLAEPAPNAIELPAPRQAAEAIHDEAADGNGQPPPMSNDVVDSPLTEAGTAASANDVPSDFDHEHAEKMRHLADAGEAPSVINVAQAPDRSALGPSNDVPYQVNTEPPTRQRLFRVLSPQSYLQRLEDDYRASGQTSPFFLPLPVDQFDSPNAPTLSALWFQSRKTAPVDPNTRLSGHIGIVDNAAQHNVGAPAEVAIYNESVGSSDMSVSITLELGSATSQFGAVFRAGEPRRWVDNVDQIEVNHYFYAMFTTTSAALWFHEPGKEEKLIQRVELPAKNRFVGTVTVFGHQVRILRDEEVVLAVNDIGVPETLWGKYCGMIAGLTEDAPTRVELFVGRRYGGEFETREWQPTAAVFRGPNVHYHPLYFEQIALERYGQHFGNLFAPWCAHLMFFADAALLPYSIGKSPPWTCQNDVGLYKPGDIVPFRIYLPVCDTHGSILQATAMALSFSLIP